MPQTKITKLMLAKGAVAVADYLDERFPSDALPGGKQLFADDTLDPGFKHERGCEELARCVLEASLRRSTR